MCGSIKRGGRRKGKKRTHLSLENCIAFIPEEGYSAIQNLEKVEISKEEVKSRNYVWTALNSVRDSATNTTTKLGGNYYSEGVISALINPSDRVERIESILTA